MDKRIREILDKEKNRQRDNIELIASENYVSNDILELQGSIFTNKYAEGYPERRYYGGCENVDVIENLAIEYVCKLFNVKYANVQPHSGSQANMAVYRALLNHGDKIMGLNLSHVGHLTHGHKVSITGKLYEVHQFDVDKETQLIDYDKLEQFAIEVQPKMMIIGTTAYSRILDWKRISEIAHKVNSYFVADIAHVAGLIAGGAYPSPIPFADVVTMTTHKTLRSARAALILCKDKFAKVIDKAVFPGLHGGPHMNSIAAVAVSLKEAQSDEFKKYAHQTIRNANKLANILSEIYGLKIVSGGTDSHLMVVDLTSRNIDGKTAAIALEKAGIECNYNTIPYDPKPPANPSGIRLGVQILTTIGMDEYDMVTVASYINKALDNYDNDAVLSQIASEIKSWLSGFYK